MLISAFPGCGKTWLFNHSDKRVLDSDSSLFDKSAFPDNYIAHIAENMDRADIVLISTHATVRSALVANGMEFVLVYPDRKMKEEYLLRYGERGNDDGFISLLESNWDGWISELERQTGCVHVVLKRGQFLSDVVEYLQG